MAEGTNNWSLFGLDLSRSGKALTLGFSQLLYDREAWLLERFDPAISVSLEGEEIRYQADKPAPESHGQDDVTQYRAIALPADQVLFKTLRLPSSTEADLDGAIALEVELSSPFSDSETQAAWRIVNRYGGILEVVLAIATRSAVNAALAANRPATSSEAASSPEVWAMTDKGVPIPFPEFGNRQRRTDYHHRLMRAAGLLTTFWCAFMLALSLLASSAALRAERLEETFQQVRIDAASAAKQREQLQIGRTRLRTIEEAIIERPNYQYWLNHIAASAPDTVYLDRLSFDGKQVTVNGYSNNAAVYLRMLTEEPGYTDVTALSAFSRDRNNGLERFSIQWRVTDPNTIDTENLIAEESSQPGVES